MRYGLQSQDYGIIFSSGGPKELARGCRGYRRTLRLRGNFAASLRSAGSFGRRPEIDHINPHNGVSKSWTRRIPGPTRPDSEILTYGADGKEGSGAALSGNLPIKHLYSRQSKTDVSSSLRYTRVTEATIKFKHYADAGKVFTPEQRAIFAPTQWANGLIQFANDVGGFVGLRIDRGN
ncbi:hypothetical protein Bbelb_397470 [Branchiostoma belcheri]|nr:hypothetical protein Bbelb_397470 [Branchiostoma belcheri]